MIKESYVKSPIELGLKTDCQGIYVQTTDARIEAMLATGFLEFGVGDTRIDAEFSTIGSRMRGHTSSKNPAWQQHLLDSIPNPGYRDYALHKEIRQTFAAQLEDPDTGKKNELFKVAVEKMLIEQFVTSKDFEPIRHWLNKRVRKCAATLNPNHEKQSINLRNIQTLVIDKILLSLQQKGIAINFVCELAARIGKTILFLELSRSMHEEFGHASMFIMAYGVGLSVKTSYKDEINKYHDFNNMQFIDASNDTAKTEYFEAIANKKVPVVFISLNPEVEEKYRWINQLTGKHIALLEETDFGTHTDSQVEKVDFILSNKDVTRINASGTNIGRLAKAFGKNAIDEIISVPYCMVEQDPSIPNVVTRKFYNMLFNGKINTLLEDFDSEILPNITKIMSKPLSQSKFISALFQDIFGYQPIYGFNISDQAGEDIKHSMLFVNISKLAMEQLSGVIEKACAEHKVLILNGDYTDNKEAEGRTKEEIVRLQQGYYKGRDKLLVITNMMGTRSYSIPEIQSCLFMQEGGDVYPYMQKYSRCLTPGFNKKYGYIFDFSFDQSKTRNTVMSVAVEAALLIREKGKTYPDAVREVLNSVNIKDMVSGQWMCSDDIIKQFEDNNKLLEIANAHTRITIEDLTSDEIETLGELAKRSITSKKEKSKIDKIVSTGKTFNSDNTNLDKLKKHPLKAIVEKAIRMINGSATTILALGNYQGESFLECIDIIAENAEMSKEFVELYGVGPSTIKRLSNRLEISTLDMIVLMSKYNTTQKHIENNALAILKDNPLLWNDIFGNREITKFIKSKLCNKILVVAGGHASEVDVLVEMFGIDILHKIVYNDKYSFFCNQIKRKYPDITVIKGDFTKLEFDMKFDVIVGNPPYQSGNGEKGGKHSLWRKIVKKTFSIVAPNGYVAMVCPGFPYQAGDLAECFTKNTPIVLVNDATSYFPGIGSEIKYWVVKEGIHNIPFNVDSKIWSAGLAEDPTVDPFVISIKKKLQGLPSFVCKQDKGYNSTQYKNDDTDYFDKPVEKSIYPIRHASTIKVCYVSKPTLCHNINKVMMTFSGYPDFEYFDGTDNPMSSCYQMSGYIEVDDETVGNLLIAVYKSKFYTFLSRLEGAGMKGVGNYSLPIVDLTRVWTDSELYAHFALTKEEIDYVEANVK